MTALYSYASSERELSFIAADNLETDPEKGTQKRADKVVLVGNRFAVGVYGKMSVAQALQTIADFQQYTNVQRIESLSDLLGRTWELTRLICQFQYEERLKLKQQGKYPDRNWCDMLASCAGLIILDCQQFIIYEVIQKQLFPPDKIDFNPEIKRKKNNKLLLFEHASFIARRDEEELNDIAIKNPIEFIKKRIEDDRQKDASIGGPGSILSVVRSKIEYRSVFDSPSDYWRNELSLRTQHEAYPANPEI